MLSAALRPIRSTQILFAATGILLLAATAYPQALDGRTADVTKAKAEATCTQTAKLNAEKR